MVTRCPFSKTVREISLPSTKVPLADSVSDRMLPTSRA